MSASSLRAKLERTGFHFERVHDDKGKHIAWRTWYKLLWVAMSFDEAGAIRQAVDYAKARRIKLLGDPAPSLPIPPWRRRA